MIFKEERKKQTNRERNRQRDKYCRDWSNIDELVLGPHTKHFPQKRRNTKGEKKLHTKLQNISINIKDN
jgi:hypothetical protein